MVDAGGGVGIAALPMRKYLTAIAIVLVLLGGLGYESYLKITWYERMSQKVSADGWVPIEGTEIKTYYLDNPATWFGTCVDSVWMGRIEHRRAAPLTSPFLIIPVCVITEKEKKLHEFFLVFSADGSSAKMFSIPGVPTAETIAKIKHMGETGEIPFETHDLDRWHHEAVLKFITR